MQKLVKSFFIVPALWTILWIASFSAVQAQDGFSQKVDAMVGANFTELTVQIDALATSGNARALPILEALSIGRLYYRKTDKKVVIAEKVKRKYRLLDPISGDVLAEGVSKRKLKKIRVNNKLRRALRATMGAMTLLSSDPETRLKAAQSVFKSGDAAALPTLEAAIVKETDPDIRTVLRQAHAVAILNSTRSDDDKRAAFAILEERGDRDALSVVTAAARTATGDLKLLADETVTTIEETLELWNAAQNIWYGLSLGSVLLLAAIGLAITFGVMGVINMAHGEMVMLGAYTTFMVQDVIRNHAPELFDASLAIALPLAFLVAGGVGVAIERGVIRFLYGRPLETLLATWGLSLVLQQTVRSIFGPTNREVGTPEFMSGAFQLGQLTITYNRLWILAFALVVMVALMLLLKYTPMGLQMRAVTQNRKMAGAMGIRTNWVDAATFGLGSGIAGIAGVALSQIDNVSPNLGQTYIIDSFMVVVFGGVGNLWGTLVGAMTLGIANKFLEPFAGAVLAKVFVLIFIILFIQKRPRGLFALKGRAVES
ncbi:MAG: urea ABC transporter permease subunit UrtB [Alphaproteobacteria bacterium]|nr:urea ABC transporter permease subunit UrtB [Alphaproteobacteria bacterium]